MSGLGGSSIKQRYRLLTIGLLLFRRSTFSNSLGACSLDYFMLCLRSGLGGSSIKQRGRLLASGLLLFRLFTLPAGLGACGLDDSLFCLKIGPGGSSIKQRDRLLSDGLLTLHLFYFAESLGVIGSGILLGTENDPISVFFNKRDAPKIGSYRLYNRKTWADQLSYIAVYTEVV